MLQNGVIRHKGKVWLGTNSLAQQHVMQAVHNSGTGGHSGVQATYYRIRQLFSWPGMKKNDSPVHRFLSSLSTG